MLVSEHGQHILIVRGLDNLTWRSPSAMMTSGLKHPMMTSNDEDLQFKTSNNEEDLQFKKSNDEDLQFKMSC